MKTNYKYFYFEQMSSLLSKKKTQTWFCMSNSDKSILAVVNWFPRWRQYCFFPKGETVFSVGCLNDIVDFVKQLNENKKLESLYQGRR